MNIEDIAFAITTCPRGIPTLDTAMQSFPCRCKIAFISNDEQMCGVIPNWLLALEQLAMISEREYLCVLQDDFLFCPYTVDIIDSIDFKDTDGYYSLFTAKQTGLVDNFTAGWNLIPVGVDVWGAMWIMKLTTALGILSDTQLQESLRGKASGLDYHIDKWFQNKGLNRYCHSPSPTIHIGQHSTLNHGFVYTHGY